MSEQLLADAKEKMKKALEHLDHELATFNTGKASPSMIDGIVVEAYGSSMKIRDVAAITTPDLRTIQIQVWDKSISKQVEKAIQTSGMGFNPRLDGDLIRIPIPELSGDRRQEMVKKAHEKGEEAKVSVRMARREAMDQIKAMKKDGEISEDDAKRLEKDVQQLTDAEIKAIDSVLSVKESELKKV